MRSSRINRTENQLLKLPNRSTGEMTKPPSKISAKKSNLRLTLVIYLQMLANARTRLKLAQELGYAEDDEEYEQLNTEIKNLEKQLKADEDTQNAFEKLKTRIAAFFKRISNFKRVSKKEVKS